MTRSVTLADFLTPAELDLAANMWDFDQHGYAQRVCDQIIKPNMDRINKALGQENDPKYLAYCVEYVMMQARRKQ